MKIDLFTERRRNFFQSVLILSSLILSLCTVGGNVMLASGSTETQNQAAGIKFDLSPTSEARFFECGVTPNNGTSSLPGLNEGESVQSVLTDRDLNTNIMGKAVFDISSVNSSIVNVPGPDLMIVEMLDPEPMNVSVSDPETETVSSKIYKPTPSNGTDMNDCRYTMNQVLIDLSGLGVQEGSTVPSVRLDNRGVQDSQIGSDIAEIFVFSPRTEGENLSSNSNTGTVPFFRQD